MIQQPASSSSQQQANSLLALRPTGVTHPVTILIITPDRSIFSRDAQYDRQDLDLFGWSLTAAEMLTLSAV
jgi:hypothetical protein